MEKDDLYAAMLHEVKNNLALLTMTLENIPRLGREEYDAPLDSARLLGHKTTDRLKQTLLIYKSDKGGLTLNAVDAHSPMDFIQELAQHARVLKPDMEVSTDCENGVPPIWFFDRNTMEMALISAIHNSANYARQRIQIKAGIHDGMLSISVHDDSDGYPDHILDAVAGREELKLSGTSLGLRFAQLIAQAHHNEGRSGELRLRNDHGAVFEILIP